VMKLATKLVSLAIVGLALAWSAWYLFFREIEQKFASTEEYFKYGSIGTEQDNGLPYWIWLVLPRMFPEYLPAPGGYAALGMLSKDGHEMPIGLSKVRIGFERVG